MIRFSLFLVHKLDRNLLSNGSFLNFGGFKTSLLQIVVLQAKSAREATLDILATHCIPSAMSDDLKT